MNQSGTATIDSNLLRWLLASKKRRAVPDLRELLGLESEVRKMKVQEQPAEASLGFVKQTQKPDPGDLTVHSPQDPGTDDLAVSQRTGLDQSIHQPVVLIVDQRITMRFGSSRNTKSIAAARTAAFLAWRALAEKKGIGAIIFNDRKWVQLRPQCNRLRVRLILHALQQDLKLRPFGGVRANPRMLNQVLRHSELLAVGNSLIVLITDSSGCDQETFSLVESLSRENAFLVALIYDPRQVCPSEGWFFSEAPLRKAETGWRDPFRCKTGNNSLGGRRPLGRGLFPNEVPVVPLSTQDDETEQLRLLWHSLSPRVEAGEHAAGPLSH